MKTARRHMVLIGLPGSGKSTVGRLAAEQLETHLTDIDRIIERATGLPIPDLFLEEGEVAFRQRERQAVLDAFHLPPHLVAPGGGWAAEPGNLDAVRGRALTVYLEVAPETAASRLGPVNGRPLLAGGPVVDRLRSLLERRRVFYREAEVVVDAELNPGTVAAKVVAAARGRGGW